MTEIGREANDVSFFNERPRMPARRTKADVPLLSSPGTWVTAKY